MALGDPYASVEELQEEFRIDDYVDDASLTSALMAASSWVTAHCGRDFNKAADATARYFESRGSVMWVDDIADATGLLVDVDDADDGTYGTPWVVNTDYLLEPANGMVDGVAGWPYTSIRSLGTQTWPTYSRYRSPLRVTAIWGWPEVPAAVKRATLIQAARLYKRRDSPEGVLGGGLDFPAIRVGTRIDPDVEMLLAPYRKFPALVA
jgi:hypothetical protein